MSGPAVDDMVEPMTAEKAETLAVYLERLAAQVRDRTPLAVAFEITTRGSLPDSWEPLDPSPPVANITLSIEWP